MKRTLITPDLSLFPRELYPFFAGAKVYDSSCSPEARVYFIDKRCGYYLKTAKKGALLREAVLSRYFHEKGLAPRVEEYFHALPETALPFSVTLDLTAFPCTE